MRDENKETKVFIHTNDSYHISQENYDWCDVYGNVNANFEFYPKNQYPKQVSLCPSFGIRNYNLLQTVCYSLTNFIRGYELIVRAKSYNKYIKREEQSAYKNIRRHFLNYLKNYKNRLPLEDYYKPVEVQDDYVFFLSTLWYSDEWNKNDEGVNLRRANFIRACKQIKTINFEGGFVGDSTSSSDLYRDCMSEHGLPLQDWLNKTKQSAVVFNTPAFWGCHGWKLGEYLAMGKAIISTPLSNDLPAPLVHGEHIHIVKDVSEQSLKEAVSYICQNKDYRIKLENNAHEYWQKYGTPTASLKLLGIK
jgi:glycosyltransferase involved in cell wall biosynthesis